MESPPGWIIKMILDAFLRIFSFRNLGLLPILLSLLTDLSFSSSPTVTGGKREMKATGTA